MLLSSPMSCDIRLQHSTSIVSRLRSPPPASCPSPTSILSSCRALQSLLQSSLPPCSASNNVTSAPQKKLESPITFAPPARTAKKAEKSYKIAKPTLKAPQRKRRRALSGDLGPSCDQENVASSKPSTPKRQRRAPPSLPLGLEQSDFEALTPQSSAQPHTPFQISPNITFVSPSQPLPFNLPIRSTAAKDDNGDTNMTDEWTAQDDSALVALILDKFRLKQSDWEECASKLGKGRDSIGERWRMLVGEGEVGLRRSKGALRRSSLMDFGPEIDK